MLKKITAILTFMLLVGSIFAVWAEEDVKNETKSESTVEIVDYASKTYEEKLAELKTYGIVNCYEDGNFYPEKEVTRAEFCKVILLSLGFSKDALWNMAENRLLTMLTVHIGHIYTYKVQKIWI